MLIPETHEGSVRPTTASGASQAISCTSERYCVVEKESWNGRYRLAIGGD